MFLITSKYLVPKNYRALTFFPFVFVANVADQQDLVLINHEKIHLRQQLEMLVLPFYLVYFLDFLIKLIKYKKTHKAYRNIIFEREAYANEKNRNYLKTRGVWRFLKYWN